MHTCKLKFFCATFCSILCMPFLCQAFCLFPTLLIPFLSILLPHHGQTCIISITISGWWSHWCKIISDRTLKHQSTYTKILIEEWAKNPVNVCLYETSPQPSIWFQVGIIKGIVWQNCAWNVFHYPFQWRWCHTKEGDVMISWIARIAKVWGASPPSGSFVQML